VFVTGVAVLGVFGLLRLGVGASTEAEDELRAALFAEDVFTTLRVYSDAMLDVRDTNRWQKLCAESGLELDPESPTLFSDFWAALAEWEGQNGMPCLPDFWEAPDSGPGESTDSVSHPHPCGGTGRPPSRRDEHERLLRGGHPGHEPWDDPGIHPPLSPHGDDERVVSLRCGEPQRLARLDVRRRSDYTFYTHIYERGERP
jgi:hypothetical protein